MADNTCPHGRDLYREACTVCRQDHAQYEKALEAVKALGQGVNGGSNFVTAAAFNHEHAYLFDKLAGAIALSTLRRTYDHLCADGARTIFADEPHPEHDGRLSCGTVIGALRMLAVKRDEDVLKARKFWLDRIYQPLA